MSSIPVVPSSSSPSSPLSPSTVSMDVNNVVNSTVMQMLSTWISGLDEIAAANQEDAKKSGDSSIQDASNIASAYPMLMLSQILINSNNTMSTSAETTSNAQSTISSIASDVPDKGTAAVYALLMSHTLDAMNPGGSATSQQVVSNWVNLGQEKAVSLLAFVAAIQASQAKSASDEVDGITNIIQSIKQQEANAGSNFAHQWLVSIQKAGEELKKIADNKAIIALQEYMDSAKKDPSLLDPARLQTAIAMTMLILLTSSSSSPVTNQSETLASQAITDATSRNPNMAMGQMDTTAAVAMIAALMAQVSQSQVVLLQLKEKPAADAKKVTETFALENAKKILGFVDDPAHHIFLTKLVGNMVGQENVQRNVELVKLNMLLSSLWLVLRAEADGTHFSDMMMFVSQYLESGKTDKNPPFPKIAQELFAKIKKKLDAFKAQFGPQAASDLQEGLEKMMDFMGGVESKDETPDYKDPKTFVEFLMNTSSSVNTPVDSTKA